MTNLSEYGEIKPQEKQLSGCRQGDDYRFDLEVLAVISTLAERAATFNEKMRARAGGAPSAAALAFARKIAAALGGKIPKQTLTDRNRLVAMDRPAQNAIAG